MYQLLLGYFREREGKREWREWKEVREKRAEKEEKGGESKETEGEMRKVKERETPEG